MNRISKIKHRLTLHFKWVSAFFVVFYIVGIAGMLVPQTFSIFTKLIPLALLLSFTALLFFHEKYSKNEWLVFLSIYILGFSAELIGVNTGYIFGNYTYGNSLGIKIFNTPLIIGINWLILVYISSSVTERIKTHSIIQVFLASLIMLFYDIIVEQLAPKLDMWSWYENHIPIKNYLSWFIIALVFNTLLKILKTNTHNKLAPVILLCQVTFFVILFIVLTFKL